MQILPLTTPLLRAGDSLAAALAKAGTIMAGDILVISSKAVATTEGAAINLRTMTIGEDARRWSATSGLPADFCEAILAETKRMHGRVVGAAPKALLTEVRPDGLRGALLVPNAGLDRSNIEEGFCIGWPREPVESVRRLRRQLAKSIEEPGTRNQDLGNEALVPRSKVLGPAIVMSDSCVHMGRGGVVAFALACSGIDPIRDRVGEQDLFGRPLAVTREAVADQLATAANVVMGNAAESVPAAIIREHCLAASAFEGWVPAIEPAEDLFRNLAPGYPTRDS